MVDLDAIALLVTTVTTALGASACAVKTDDMSVGTAYKTACKKAVKTVVNCLHDDNSAPEEVLPVYIGIDEFGNVHADIIEQEFHPVLKNFSASYFENCVECQNRIEYHFHAHDLKLDFTDEWGKISYLREIAEQVVHRHIHKVCPSIGSLPNNLVALNLQGDKLLISIAKNNTGIQENTNYMNMLRKNLKQISQPQTPTYVDDELEKDLEELN